MENYIAKGTNQNKPLLPTLLKRLVTGCSHLSSQFANSVWIIIIIIISLSSFNCFADVHNWNQQYGVHNSDNLVMYLILAATQISFSSFSEADWWSSPCWKRTFTEPFWCANWSGSTEWAWLSQSLSVETWWAYGMWRHQNKQDRGSDKGHWQWFLGMCMHYSVSWAGGWRRNVKYWEWIKYQTLLQN